MVESPNRSKILSRGGSAYPVALSFSFPECPMASLSAAEILSSLSLAFRFLCDPDSGCELAVANNRHFSLSSAAEVVKTPPVQTAQFRAFLSCAPCDGSHAGRAGL